MRKAMCIRTSAKRSGAWYPIHAQRKLSVHLFIGVELEITAQPLLELRPMALCLE